MRGSERSNLTYRTTETSGPAGATTCRYRSSGLGLACHWKVRNGSPILANLALAAVSPPAPLALIVGRADSRQSLGPLVNDRGDDAYAIGVVVARAVNDPTRERLG